MFSPHLRRAVLCASVIFMISEAGARVQTNTACQGPEGGLCSEHNVQCPQGTAFFPLRARRGFKPQALVCTAPVPNCDEESKRCCSLEETDCFVDYDDEAFTSLTGNGNCLNEASCRFRVPRLFIASNPFCSNTFPEYSTYSSIDYVCINDQEIVDVTNTNTTSGPDIALTYVQRSPTADKVISCRIEAEDCSSTNADVIFVRTPNTRPTTPCTSLQVDGKAWLPCVAGNMLVWRSSPQFTPFTVNLRVESNNDAQQAWAVIHSRASLRLTATCRNSEASSAFPQCFVPQSTTPIESTADDTSTTFSSTSSSQISTISTAPVEVGEPEIVVSSSSFSNAVLAGVVAGAVVGILVLVGLCVGLVFCIIPWVASKRRTSPRDVAYHPNTSAMPPSYGFNSPPPPAASAAAASSDDYDHLGKLRPTLPTHDGVYGHAQIGADVTEDAYDHVSRGQQAPVSGKVIDNVYSTAGRAGAASSLGGDVTYDVAGNPHRRDVIDSPYDVASRPV